MYIKTLKLIPLLCACFVSFAHAENTVVFNMPKEGSVSQNDGLSAWDTVYEVLSHPRCSNCHVGANNIPMWSGPSYGKSRPHGMNINAGDSRIGAEYIPCSTCHLDKNNTVPHAAPGVSMDWQLAPPEAEWFGKSSHDVCTQLRNPDLNGDRTVLEIAEHLDHDLILHWAWDPGPGREPAPHSLQTLTDYLLKWGAAGTPCPQ